MTYLLNSVLEALVLLFLGVKCTCAARLGLKRDSYGVFDRSGFQSLEHYPYLVGQRFSTSWAAVNPANGIYNWSALLNQLQDVKKKKQNIYIRIQPAGGEGGPPRWIFEEGVTELSDGVYTYGDYRERKYKQFFNFMVTELGHYVRNVLSAEYRSRISFVRVDTGATGDESPFEEEDQVYKVKNGRNLSISDNEWRRFREDVFGMFNDAFQKGTADPIPLLFQAIEETDYNREWDWVISNVKSGFGVKYGGNIRGHHLDKSEEVPRLFKGRSVDSDFGLFSRNEMDQTWNKTYFRLNIPLGMYWCAVEQLNAGLSVWDVTKSALNNSSSDKEDFQFAFHFFNKWAAELDPETAGGGFVIFHEGLNSANTEKFPENDLFGTARRGNTDRYEAIVQVYASRGARLDDPASVNVGQVKQRRVQKGYNDAGWDIWDGNYDRFISQLDPDRTSVGLWRINGTLTNTSHPYNRFARGFEAATGRNKMFFVLNEALVTKRSQKVRVSVTYFDKGFGVFDLLYDANDAQNNKRAIRVSKGNTLMWKTAETDLSDWRFQRKSERGSDLILDSVDEDDDVFHKIEVQKLVSVNISPESSSGGSVSVRHLSSLLTNPIVELMQGCRLDITAVPEDGWSFKGWTGDATGNSTFLRLFPEKDVEVRAVFERI